MVRAEWDEEELHWLHDFARDSGRCYLERQLTQVQASWYYLRTNGKIADRWTTFSTMDRLGGSLGLADVQNETWHAVAVPSIAVNETSIFAPER